MNNNELAEWLRQVEATASAIADERNALDPGTRQRNAKLAQGLYHLAGRAGGLATLVEADAEGTG